MKRHCWLSLFLLALYLSACHKDVDNIESFGEEEKIVDEHKTNSGVYVDIGNVSNPKNIINETFNLDVSKINTKSTLSSDDKDEMMKYFVGDYLYDLNQRYLNSDYITRELCLEMYEAGFIYSDFDNDGVTNYQEYEVYHSDPNKKSTSGDIYSDGYKVLWKMDLNTYYEVDWTQASNNIFIYPVDMDYIGASIISPEFTYNYLDFENLVYLNLSTVYNGYIRLYLNEKMRDIDTVEIYNTWTLEHEVIESIIGENELGVYIEFFEPKGYDSFLLYKNGLEFDIEDWVNHHK